ncbi:MAG: DPP IV N-terminal domain-containing protein [Gemmatimonadota bacterium]
MQVSDGFARTSRRHRSAVQFGRLPYAAMFLATIMARGACAQSTGPRVYHATRQDYDRAAAVYRGSVLLKNGVVIPHWIAGTDEFWYRRDLPRGHDFVIVDAATGRKRAVFDHDSLAGALSKATSGPLSATDLPITDLTLVGRSKGSAAVHVTLPAPSSAGIALTPDGRFFTAVSQEYDCVLAPAAHCAKAEATTVVEGMTVSPDGKWGVVEKAGNIWLRDLATGQERQLTKDGEGPNNGYGIYPGGWKAAAIPRERQLAIGHSFPPLETYWSPDSRRVITPHFDQRGVADYPYLETVPGDGSFRPKVHMVRVPLVGEKTTPVEWFAIDVTTGTVTRLGLPYEKLLVLQQDLLAVRKTWWGPGNTHLFAVAFGDNMESAYLFDVDIATGTVRTVIEEREQPRTDLNPTSYNPPNVRVTGDGKEVIWWSQRDGWGHLYLYDAETGRLKNRITSGSWLVRDLIEVDENRRRIYFTGGGRESGNPYYRHLYRVNFDGTGLTLLSPEAADAMLTGQGNDLLAIDGGVDHQVVSPSGKYVVYNSSTPSQPTRSVIRTVDGRLVATFEQADASALFAAGYRAPEEFVAKTADGKDETWNVIYKPANFDSTERYAVIDAEYASPLTAVVPRNFVMAVRAAPGAHAASFAALGFVAVVVDGRGTTYRSKAFTQSTYGKLNINGLDDHVAAINELGRRHAYVDTTRVGITGGSYGGWSAFRGMLEFPDFYKVGVTESPPGSEHNMYIDYHATAMHGRPVYSDGTELRPTPAEVPKNWNVIDGRQQADRLKGHLLIIMSELDENVSPGSTLQLIDAFMKANKDFDLIYLPNTPHGSGQFTAYTRRRRWDYFVRYLMEP